MSIHSIAPSPAQAPEPLALGPRGMEAFLSCCHRRRYQKHSAVFRPGDNGLVFYYVVEGDLAVITEDEDGRSFILDHCRTGDFIGEMGLFTAPAARSVSLVAQTPAVLAEIDTRRLLHLLSSELSHIAAPFLYAVGTQLSRRLRATTRRAGHLALLDVRGRIEQALNDLCREPGAMLHPKGAQLHISRVELARMVGCSREMAGRVVRQLHDEGKIEARGKRVVVFQDPPVDPGQG